MVRGLSFPWRGQGRGGVKAGPEQGGGVGSRLGLQEHRKKGAAKLPWGSHCSRREGRRGLELGCTCFDCWERNISKTTIILDTGLCSSELKLFGLQDLPRNYSFIVILIHNNIAVVTIYC